MRSGAARSRPDSQARAAACQPARNHSQPCRPCCRATCRRGTSGVDRKRRSAQATEGGACPTVLRARLAPPPPLQRRRAARPAHRCRCGACRPGTPGRTARPARPRQSAPAGAGPRRRGRSWRPRRLRDGPPARRARQRCAQTTRSCGGWWQLWRCWCRGQAGGKWELAMQWLQPCAWPPARAAHQTHPRQAVQAVGRRGRPGGHTPVAKHGVEDGGAGEALGHLAAVALLRAGAGRRAGGAADVAVLCAPAGQAVGGGAGPGHGSLGNQCGQGRAFAGAATQNGQTARLARLGEQRLPTGGVVAALLSNHALGGGVAPPHLQGAPDGSARKGFEPGPLTHDARCRLLPAPQAGRPARHGPSPGWPRRPALPARWAPCQ